MYKTQEADDSDIFVPLPHVRAHDECLVAGRDPNAVRKRSRNASIRQTGACGLGRKPDCQSHPLIRFSTDGSWEMTEIGTSWFAPCPLTTGNGCSSPTTTSTRFFLP